MQRFACQNCGNYVYFDSTRCVHCHQHLGYVPSAARVLSSADGTHYATEDGAGFRPCRNAEHLACNWLIGAAEPGRFCFACRHNNVIPDLSDTAALAGWRRLEAAKRALFYSLVRWGLPAPTKAEAGDRGLAFDFLADEVHADGSVRTHLTGHASGLITINVAEADDAERERRRSAMGEPYRTLVGHFRHEVGHYYWDRLVAEGPDVVLSNFRILFGDERSDYGAALERHYREGPAEWRERFVSAYAAAHPWEDFAETFAHYVHMTDALDTAGAFGLATGEANPSPVSFDPYLEGTLPQMLSAWVPLTVALNAINRSMGQPDLYPFVLPVQVVDKLAFVHGLIRSDPSDDGEVSAHSHADMVSE